ncbi:MAG: hypothetical protein HY815_07375 [Candidatus Riflebacteria bacterium]|nr:hypothetical protein [Candidatus Riflebacteria bacterium]
MHHQVRLATLLLVVVLLLGAGGTARAETLPTSPSWIDGTHILAEAYRDAIAKLPEMPGARQPSRRARRGVQIGEPETFWAMNVASNQPYQLKAILRKIGKSCYVYVEDGHTVADEVLEGLIKQYDQVIYPTDRKWFGSEPTPGIDGDPRITLLFLDIQDGWTPGKGYVAGYFFPLDCISASLFPQSNEREMFYLDVKPGDPRRKDFMGVVAHEFQHMIHYNNDRKETRWLNEAMSQLAFYVCGYGHAPQIFSYVHGTDVNLEDFQNSLESYGAVYLFGYYVYLHYAGETLDAKEKFFKTLVANQKTGLDGVQDALAKIGVTKNIKEIFADWATANAACDATISGGRFGYGAELSFGVNNPDQTCDLATVTPDVVKKELNPWAADYIVYATDTTWTPRRPTMLDKIQIAGAKAGKVVWNVNDRQLPPAKLIPEGSTVNETERTVTTPLKADENGKPVALIGPFLRLGVEIRTLNFRFSYEDGSETLVKSIPISTLPSLVLTGAEKARKAASDKLVFTFEGEKDKPVVVRAIVKRLNGTTAVFDVTLDPKNKGQWTLDSVGDDLDSLTVAVIGFQFKKKMAYSYSLVKSTAREEIREKQFDSLQRGSAMGGPLGKLGSLGITSHASPAIAQAAVKRSDDEDTSHDNLSYVFSKNQELLHSLTHLMIDPAFLEGQLFKLWKLLELIRNFPHLPLPDGLAFVDFDCTKAQNLIIGWAKEFDVPVIGLPETQAPPLSGHDPIAVKETAKRLKLAHSIVEFSYNSGLTLAQDFSMTLYYFGRFIFCSKTTLDTVAKHFSHIPVIGTLASKLTKLIIGKLIRAGDNVIWFIAAKIRPPYSTIVPIAYSVITWAVARTMDIPLDPGETQGFAKEYLVGTFGKYVLASVPKVGYVSRGQAAVDLAADMAGKLVANGSLKDAVKKVWDDGDLNTANSIREQIAIQVVERHNKALNDQHIAWITGKLSEVANLVSVIDPTSISRIVAIVLQVGTAGVFAHAGWVTASYFFALPRGEALRGVKISFDPAVDTAGEPAATLASGRLDRAFVSLLSKELDDTFAEYVTEAEKVAADPQTPGGIDRVFGLDGKLDRLTTKAQGLIFGVEPGKGPNEAQTASDSGLEEVFNESQSCLFQRAALMSDLFARRAGSDQAVRISSNYAPVFNRYLDTIRRGLQRIAGRTDTAIPLFVSDSTVEKTFFGSFMVRATVTNGSDTPVSNVTVDLASGYSLDVQGGTKRKIATIGAGREVEVSWKVKLTEAKPAAMPTVTMTVETEGVKGLSRTQILEQ